MCDFWHVVGVVFCDIALWNVFSSCGHDNHIELFDVDVNVGGDVVELLEFLFSVVQKVIPHRFLKLVNILVLFVLTN